jgi:glycolate oxidase FAD binding subunit
MSTHADAIGLRPTSAAELAEILAADSTPYEIAGFGSKRAIGQPVDAARLDLSALAGIVDYRPSELVLTAKPGTPLDEVRALLAGHGQRLAFEPPSLATLLGAGEAQTLGGIVAANLSGSRRVAAGSARDHCLGVTAVDGRGETFRAGGQVVKNVTGYDLPKLLAGSWGTLAVISELTLKVVPLAETELTLIIADASPAESVARLSAALGSPHEVSRATDRGTGGLGCGPLRVPACGVRQSRGRATRPWHGAALLSRVAVREDVGAGRVRRPVVPGHVAAPVSSRLARAQARALQA